ncbi:MAG: Mrp/NBP35 family ATP-binding protein [Lachnospiraceae bacterium]|nr:Mrp/NBP35 family ATP-binding protein [Lachnospiraceae bacterium]
MTEKNEERNPYSSIRKVIGVVSGKGGVGKSSVTSFLASALTKKGYRVGILDADITGPSIPKMFGIHTQATSNEQGLLPQVALDGTKVMSINLLTENEETPVIWRGPVVARAVKQFWTDVVWGELDYLLVDMPPGTGDVPLTVFQSLPVDGVLIVTSPQELVQLIVKKAYHMAETMQIPVLGIIENYSYLECPDCGKRISVFGESRVEDTAAQLGISVLGRLPLNQNYAAAADAGRIYEVENEYIATAVETVERALPCAPRGE